MAFLFFAMRCIISCTSVPQLCWYRFSRALCVVFELRVPSDASALPWRGQEIVSDLRASRPGPLSSRLIVELTKAFEHGKGCIGAM